MENDSWHRLGGLPDLGQSTSPSGAFCDRSGYESTIKRFWVPRCIGCHCLTALKGFDVKNLNKRSAVRSDRKSPPSQLLLAMRHVFRVEGVEQDTTQPRKLCRAMLKEDPKGFMSQLARLEQAHKSAGGRSSPAPVATGDSVAPAPSPAALPPDEGADKVLALLAEEWAQIEAALK